MDQAMESRDSSGPYLASETASLPGKTKNMVPEWWNSWQRRNRGNMALLNTPMWIAARLLEEEPAVSIGLLWIWTHPSKLNEATHQRVQEINQMVDQEAITTLENLQTQKYVHLAGKTGKLTMGLQLGVPRLAGKIGVAALLDSSCNGSSINHHFVKRNNIPMRKVENPVWVLNANGTENKHGYITEYVTLQVQIDEHSEKLDFTVTQLNTTNVYLGLEWLRWHNPFVNWKTG
jgi:hypothetical protein